jgi:hypothetical protein
MATRCLRRIDCVLRLKGACHFHLEDGLTGTAAEKNDSSMFRGKAVSERKTFSGKRAFFGDYGTNLYPAP